MTRRALGSTLPEHFLFPAVIYRSTKAEHRGTGYEPTRHQKSWRTAWRSLRRETVRRAGKDAAAFEGLRFHDLRHTAITKLAEGQASNQTIMSLAGHLDEKMLAHYSHIRDGAKRRAVDGISSWRPEDPPAAPADVPSASVN